MHLPPLHRVFGVDFSGAELAGRFIWIAELDARRRRPTLRSLHRLDDLCGCSERGPALAHLVDLIRATEGSLWAIDFPFGLPIEVPGGAWPSQFPFLAAHGDDAYSAGVACVHRAKALGLPIHVRRTTDVEARTPFDCYHYRIIYQTFFGMRDVLGPLRRDPRTAVLPFQYAKARSAKRILVEACPASTLKRLGLPHQNYKQPAGGPLTALRRRNRRTLIDALAGIAAIDDRAKRVMMRNPGGDAIDAVIAAVGAWQAHRLADHAAVAKHPRYRREGRIYC